MTVRRTLLLLIALLAPLLATAPAQAADDSTLWLCRPGLASNPCEIGLDTTFQHADGTSTVSTLPRPANSERPVDCFFVYPTVSNDLALNARRRVTPELVSIAKYQASRFSSQCRVFAPVYRQVTLLGIPGALLLGTSKIAYADVLAAWKDYLAHDNHGRGVVFIGHSQGSLMLRKLIREQIDPDPAVRSQLVGGVLLGGNVTVAKGKTTGGDFTHVPTCSERGEVGCIVAYSTYAADPLIAFFGNSNTDTISRGFGLPSGSGGEVACTDPAVVSGNHSEFGVTVPSEPFAPGPINLGIAYSTNFNVPTAATTWVSPPDRFQGTCKTVHGAHIFRYDPVGAQSRRPNEFPPTWGTHLFDVNLGLEKLVSIVHQQAAGWVATHAG